MGGMDTAAKLRDLIRKIAREVVAETNPPPRIGTVQRIDRENNVCFVVFSGDPSPIRVNMTPGAQPRYAAYDVADGSGIADTVRVGGRPGAYYLMHVISSSSVNRQVEEQLDGVVEEVNDISDLVGTDSLAPQHSPTPVPYPANAAIAMDWDLLKIGPRSDTHNPDPVKYELHVSASNSVVTGPSTLLTADTLPPTFVRNLPRDQAPLPYDADTYFAIVAYDADGKAEASGWVGARPRKASDPDLAITGDALVSNFALIEALKAVDVSISGELTASTITAIGKIAMRDPDNEVAQGANLRLRNKTTAPATGPITAEYVPVVDVDPTYAASGNTSNRGEYYNGRWYLVEVISGTSYIASYDGVTGARQQHVALVKPANSYYSMISRIGTSWYVWYQSSNDSHQDAYFQIYDDTFTLTSTVAGVRYQRIANSYNFIFGRTADSLIVAGLKSAASASDVSYEFIHEVNPATGAITSTTRTANNAAFASAIMGNYYRMTVIGGNFDFGAKRYVFAGGVGVYVYNTSAARVTAEEFTVAANGTSGFAWDGTRFLQLVTSAPARKLYKYTTGYWTATARDTLWVAGTWANDVSTLQETALGTRTKYIPRKRWAVRLTFPDFPSTANKVGVYVGSGATQPTAYTAYFSQGLSGSKFVNLELPVTIAGSNPPDPANNTRDFTGGSAAGIRGDDGSYWLADGTHSLDQRKNLADVPYTNVTRNGSATSGQIGYQVRAGFVFIYVDLGYSIATNTQVQLVAAALPASIAPALTARGFGFFAGHVGTISVGTDGNVLAIQQSGATRATVNGYVMYPLK